MAGDIDIEGSNTLGYFWAIASFVTLTFAAKILPIALLSKDPNDILAVDSEHRVH
jgi:hypothetical protein